MVLQIWKIAELEDSKLQATADVLQKRNMEDASWANVLGAMRVAHIDLSSHEIETTGGGTSDVTVIKYPNTKLFYKKEEKTASAAGRCESADPAETGVEVP